MSAKIASAIKTREFATLFALSLIIFTLLTNTISVYGLAYGEILVPEGTQIDTPIFLVLFSLLFSLSLKLNIDNYRGRTCPISKKGVTGAVALLGLLSSACPICPPLLLSLFGVTASALIFPFGGYEVKAAAVMLAAFSLYLAAKN